MAKRDDRTNDRSQARRQEILRRNTRELYALLGTLGERIFAEGMLLYEDEREAAAWASATLVRSLEERELLDRIERAP